MLWYCQLDLQEETSVKLYQNIKLFIHENASKELSAKWWPFCSGGDELNGWETENVYCHQGVQMVNQHLW